MKKWIFIWIGIILVGFIGYQWFSSKTTSAKQVSTQVRKAVVQTGKLEVKVSGSGTVQPVTSEDITSTINNNEIGEVLVAAGDKVEKGDELITFTNGDDPITAPEAGVVTTLSVAVGERVTTGQVVAHLTNYTNLQTVVQIDELDIPSIKIGQTVALKINAYPDQSFTGKVTNIADEGTTTNGVSTFDVTIHIDKPQNVKVGMTTEASILTASKENAIYVPLDAVHTMNNQKYVIISSANGSKEQKEVKTGLANEDFVEITEGLTGGETVQMPQLAKSTTTGNFARGMMQGGGFGGFSGMKRNSGGNGYQGRSGNQ